MRGEEEADVTEATGLELGRQDDGTAEPAGLTADEARPASDRERIFKEEMAGIARRYVWHYRDQPGSNDLLVIFSSTAKRHAFMGQAWSCNVLFVLDRDDAYFVIGAGRAADAIGAAIDRAGLDRVLFLGSSKGGFGAVLWSALCARRRPEKLFRALAFSPQTRLYPFNEELDFRSYKLLWRRAETDPRVMASLKAYGDLRIAQKEANALVTFVYGERNQVDRREVGRLFAPQFRKYPVPLRFHGSVIPFTVRHMDEETLSKWLRNLYTRAEDEPDLSGILPTDPAELVAEFRTMRWIPSLPVFIEECLSLGTSA